MSTPWFALPLRIAFGFLSVYKLLDLISSRYSDTTYAAAIHLLTESLLARPCSCLVAFKTACVITSL